MVSEPEQLELDLCDNTLQSISCPVYKKNKDYWDFLSKKKELTKKEKKALKDKRYRERHKESLRKRKKEYFFKISSIRKEEKKRKLKEEFDLLSKREEEKEWQPMKDWENYYEIRLRKDTGTIEVRYKHNKKILEPYFSKYSYLYSLDNTIKKTSIAVQKLIAIHYIENPKKFVNVIYLDGDKKNNKLSNLKWGKKKCKTGADSHASKGTIKVYKDGVFQFNLNGRKEISERGFNDSCVYKCTYGLQKNYKEYTFVREGLSEEEKKSYIEKSEKKKIQNRPKKTAYVLNRLKKDPNFKILTMLRKRICNVLKSKKNKKCFKSVELLGCSIEHCKKHLESKFKEGMKWENHGKKGWHIDHIIPCVSFDLTDPEQQKKCFHYTNLQPLWWQENLAKGSKILN
jgi:hypothetical protein